MATKIDLKPFCAANELAIGYPRTWVVDGYEYATDCAIAIRVPIRESSTCFLGRRPPNAKERFEEFNHVVCESDWSGPFSDKCDHCGQPIAVATVGGKKFSIRYLNLISRLPQPIKYCVIGEILKVTAGDATVILMSLGESLG